MKQSVCSHPATKFIHLSFIKFRWLKQFTHNSFYKEPLYPHLENHNLCSPRIPILYQNQCGICCQIDGKVSSIHSNGFPQHRQHVIKQLNQQIGKQKLMQITTNHAVHEHCFCVFVLTLINHTKWSRFAEEHSGTVRTTQ